MSNTVLFDTLKKSDLDQYYTSFLSFGISHLNGLAQISMQDYGSLGITSISDRKRLFQLVQTLRHQQDLSIMPSSPSNRDFTDESSASFSSFGDMRTPQQQPSSRMRFPLKTNMIGLSSVSYVKKTPTMNNSKDQVPPNISTSMSSPRISSPCRSPFTAKRNQLPVFIRKQQEEVEEEEEDDREIVKNSHLNPYGLPISSNNRHLAQRKSDLNQKIRVCVRKRPLAKKEIEKSEKDITPVQGIRTVHVNEPKVKVDLTKYIEQHTFNFDDVFDTNSTNDYIYQRTAQPLVKYIFGGGKATCFAYGQTGSGKTYTMMDPKHGLYILAAQDIFNMLQQPEYGHLCAWIGFYEIYQGQLYDLLADRKKLFAREDGKQNVVIVGLKEYLIKNVSDLMQVFEYGNQIRSTGSTGANSDSSRSHAIMQVLLKPISAGRKKSVEPIGKLSFIDLAGSERGADRGETDLKTRMEGAEINKSLLALKECIRALDQDKKHTPFRQSKLTQVLKDSFVGNSRTCMIATVSPNQSNSEHTLNTLRYADRVKELKNGGLVCSSSSDQELEQHMITSSNTMPNMTKKEDMDDEPVFLLDHDDLHPCSDALLDTDFPHEFLSTTPPTSSASPPITPPQQYHHLKNQFDLSMIEDFISQHRNEIRATNECSKKETRYLTHVSLGLTTDNRLKMSSAFIDYLSHLDDILDQKMAAIDHLKEKIRLVLNQVE
ncbi:oligomeric, coiled-coil, peripheral membrane protein [Mucor velutinosus]|uniref:Kinesin-like protein n=1 Tax=Mucor velutinosus TaxID=708070 RepID=A0AAN7DST9_9FUNG|nr:oligomeric, coiled-coil, peripheral membrane protein [Mucor velutinosus]